MSYRHTVRVRYGECDMQGVAFNAHYMAWMDDATEVWVRGLSPGGDYHAFDWEWMVVKSVIEWQSSARNADLLDIDLGIVRWGRSSFDFGFRGSVDGRAVFSGRTVAVSVKPVTLEKMDTPAAVRELLGAELDWDVPR